MAANGKFTNADRMYQLIHDFGFSPTEAAEITCQGLKISEVSGKNN